MGPFSAAEHGPQYSTLEGGLEERSRVVEEANKILEQTARVWEANAIRS